MNEMLIQQLIGSTRQEQYALVVSGSPRGTAPELVSRLARDAAFIVAVDSGADVLYSTGLAPHLLLGDFDSIQQDTLAAYRAAGVELATHDVHKDETDLELALQELRRRHFTSVMATNVLGGRIDHELASLGCLAAAAEQGMVVTVAERGEFCVFLSAAGGHTTLCLDFSPKERFPSILQERPVFISLIPWGGEATVSIGGVEWELDHAVLTPTSSRGVSNMPKADLTPIEVHAGTLIVVLEFQEGIKR
jgi:thiamine pyrophosphokinase